MQLYIRRIATMLRNRKGAASVEFVTILPLVLLISMAVWQFAIFSLAIMDTHSAIRDAIKVASVTGDVKTARKEGISSFGKSNAYKLKKLSVKVNHGEVTVSANTNIPIIFVNSKAFTYSSDSDAPVLNNVAASYGFGSSSGRHGGAFLNGAALPGGKLAAPIHAAPGVGINGYSGHTGQDFPAPIGTNIFAAESGRVLKVVNLGDRSYGTYIVIDHGGGIQTLYAHMYDDQPVVHAGQSVTRGQKIGESGNNGNSSGPHLHFEVRIGGHPVDPMPFLR
ncbi:M23 family metallopeptidase [Marininema halotolerans]|uniref:Murein DD-endopeptidase MepM and murein hydrolase activator NlpD, contain LysM domain n=1 Tax=Marininema halotolerans TaxID=1155944 RepID=A0A1I6T9T6_9BACL|nr:M23 family metallopeptidase [Marininema halotolerans]SFS85903.1 Murein DD-endopeptidase MepM and murein hydrolase activator NlpD, contain LysM domain [Marininema halotolerans]